MRNKRWGAIEITVDRSKSLRNEGLVVPTATCFCDIPKESFKVHATKYGVFGLSVPRPLLVKYGARPVTYIPFSGTDRGSPFGGAMLDDIESIYRSFVELVADRIDDSAPRKRTMRQPARSSDDAVLAMKSMLEKDLLAFIKPFDADAPIETFQNYYLEREWRKYGNMQADASTIAAVFVGADFVDRFKNDQPSLADRVEPLAMELVDAATRCHNCQQPLPTDSRLPCPQCGTLRKRHGLSLESRANATSGFVGNDSDGQA
jgi:hypothetical protein